MIKKICRLFSILLPITVSVVCSRFDDTTGLGKAIINDIDSSLTDLSKNFMTTDCVLIDSAFSIPNSGDSIIGFHNDFLTVGNRDSVSASGYVEFQFDSTIWKRFNFPDNQEYTFTVDSIYFRFDIRLKDSILPSKINLYASTLADKYNRSSQAKQYQIATLTIDSTDSNYYSGYAISSLADSVENFFVSFHQGSKSDTLSLCLFNNDSTNLVHLSKSPVIRVISRIESNTVKDTVKVTISSSHANYIAAESNPESRSAKPISAFSSQRIAVFKVDLSQLKQITSTTDFSNVFAAGFTVSPKSLSNMNFEDNRDTLYPAYLLSDCLLSTNDTALQDSSWISFRDGKNVSPIINNVSTDTINLQYPVSFFNRSSVELPSTVYLYIKLVTGRGQYWREVCWDIPKFNAILTTQE